MYQQLSPEVREAVRQIPFMPSVTIILPFNPAMSNRSRIEQQIEWAENLVREKVLNVYDDDLAALTLQKLKNVFRKLNFGTFARSVAIFLSPVYEKVLYLTSLVNRKISVDDSFSIRELVFAKKTPVDYLILSVNRSAMQIFRGNCSGVMQIQYRNIEGLSDDLQKNTIKNNLEIISQAYPVPVFFIGDRESVRSFRSMPSFGRHIVDYIESPAYEISKDEAFELVRPALNNWDSIRAEHTARELGAASEAGKLVTGLKEILGTLERSRGSLLVISENLIEDYVRGYEESTNPNNIRYNKYSYIRNELDDIFAKILEDGGEIELSSDPLLNRNHFIAMIKK